MRSSNIRFIIYDSKGLGASALKIAKNIYGNNLISGILGPLTSDEVFALSGSMLEIPILIPKLIEPLLEGTSELTKGNRFTNPRSIKKMPIIRIIGNIGLGFITKLSTGYWELFDPTNGFIALRTEVLREISIEKIDNGYFFETDLLFRCSLNNTLIRLLQRCRKNKVWQKRTLKSRYRR